MSSSTVSLKVLAVDPLAGRLRVRVGRYHPGANLPLNCSFFVRMLASLAREVGGNPTIDAALRGRLHDDAFVDTHTWRYIAGYSEASNTSQDEGVYVVTVTDPAWLDGLAVGLACDTTDYSTWPDEVTAQEHQAIPPLRTAARVDLPTPEVLGLDLSSDGELLAVHGAGGALTVLDTTSWRVVAEKLDVGPAGHVRFVPGTPYLVPDWGPAARDAVGHARAGRAVNARTGEVVDRAVALGEWTPRGPLAGRLWVTSSHDGRRRVVLGRSDVLALTDETGAVLREYPASDFPRLSRDGRVLVVGGDAALEVWDTTREAPPQVLSVRDTCADLALSPDGAYALTQEGRYRHVYVRRLSDGAILRYGTPWHDRHGESPTVPLWSHDGRFVVVAMVGSSPGVTWLAVHTHPA